MQSECSVELSYLQTLVALPLVKEPLVHAGYEDAWVQVLVGYTSVINRLLLELSTQCDAAEELNLN